MKGIFQSLVSYLLIDYKKLNKNFSLLHVELGLLRYHYYSLFLCLKVISYLEAEQYLKWSIIRTTNLLQSIYFVNPEFTPNDKKEGIIIK